MLIGPLYLWSIDSNISHCVCPIIKATSIVSPTITLVTLADVVDMLAVVDVTNGVEGLAG